MRLISLYTFMQAQKTFFLYSVMRKAWKSLKDYLQL